MWVPISIAFIVASLGSDIAAMRCSAAVAFLGRRGAWVGADAEPALVAARDWSLTTIAPIVGGGVGGSAVAAASVAVEMAQPAATVACIS